MALTSGTRLGPYEIVAPLGAGGMGEVYRARDARLGRDVAIKALPAAFGADLERLAREAREPIRIERELRRQYFQRDVTRQLRVARAIHLAHAARADGGNDLVCPDAAPRCQCQSTITNQQSTTNP